MQEFWAVEVLRAQRDHTGANGSFSTENMKQAVRTGWARFQHNVGDEHRRRIFFFNAALCHATCLHADHARVPSLSGTRRSKP